MYRKRELTESFLVKLPNCSSHGVVAVPILSKSIKSLAAAESLYIGVMNKIQGLCAGSLEPVEPAFSSGMVLVAGPLHVGQAYLPSLDETCLSGVSGQDRTSKRRSSMVVDVFLRSFYVLSSW